MVEEYLKTLQKRVQVLLAIAVALFLALVFFIYQDYRIGKQLEKIEREIEQIDVKVKKIDLTNAKIDGKIELYKNNFAVINDNIENNNSKIDKLIKDGKNKKDAFVSFDANMFERYFTDRYKEIRRKEHGTN